MAAMPKQRAFELQAAADQLATENLKEVRIIHR
jgi:hypothetical protein